MRDIEARHIWMAAKLALAIIIIAAMIVGALVVELAPPLFHWFGGLI